MKTKQAYFKNALLLTAVALLMRTVSVSFNVYVTGKVGAEAMGLLALVFGVYNFALTLATSGIHLATVRTISARLEATKGAENGRCLAACLAYAAFFGTLASFLQFVLAYPVGAHILHDTRTVRALRLLSFTLLPIALTSVLNGYFTAVRRAWKNALAQVSEQCVKILFTGYLLVVVAPKTTEGCLLAVLSGGAVAEILSLLFNIILYTFDKRRFKSVPRQKYGARVRVANIALPVAVSTYIRSALLAVENVLIPRGLIRHGSDRGAALAAYGALHGMALPVILYPAAILASFAALVIPEVTELQSADNKTEIRYIAGRAYQMTLLFSIGVGGLMIALAKELGLVLYNNPEVARDIALLAPLVPIMYLDTATDAMLKGLGEQVYSMNVNILDTLISVVAVALLVPKMGIDGYILTIYVTEIFNASLSIARLISVSAFRPSLIKWIGRPLLSVIGAAAFLQLTVRFLIPVPLSSAALVLHIALFVALYCVFLFVTGGFAKQDYRWLLSSIFKLPEKRRTEKQSKDRAVGTCK